MIKQIQLRGISRTPSDRMSEDGGLSESLNMYMDSAENAPAFVPEDKTAELGLPKDLYAERIFIHKTANYENYIVVQSDKVVAYTPGIEDEEPLLVMELAEGEKVNDITSVGNTLIVSTTANLYYILYKDRVYSFLGHKVPFPYVNFNIERRDSKVIGVNSWASALTDEDEWNSDANNVDGHQISTIVGDLNSFFNKLNENSFPLVSSFFLRYSVDILGEEYSSVPILINPYQIKIQGEFTEVTRVDSDMNETSSINSSLSASLDTFDILTSIENTTDLYKWADTLGSLSIYIGSPYLKFANSNRSYQSDRTDETSGSVTGLTGEVRHITATITPILNTQSFLDASAVYFKIKDIPIFAENKTEYSEEFKSFLKGETLELQKYLDPTSENYVQLETQDRLEDDDMKHYVQTSDRIDSYNNSLILTQPSQIIDYDYNRLNAYDIVTREASNEPKTWVTYDVTYLLRSYKIDKVVKKQFTYNETEKIYAFQIFPDSRAYKMIVKATKKIGGVNGTTEIKYGEFNMLPHPYLDCVYYYGGIENELIDLCTQDSIEDYPINQIDDLDNKLIISEIDNPFRFPTKNRFTFQSKVLGVAVAATALSQGQFGQFPLYVFTEDGIWAMETAADGSFISQKPLSREVCINPDSITSIDNAVVFVTAKGVMMIQGSQVMNISPYMNGKHFVPSKEIQDLISNQEGFCNLVSAISDEDSFMSFIKEAQVAYDYPGQRLIFINPSERNMQYIYKIDTQTWHKSMFEGLYLYRPLNSFPECLVQTEPTNKDTILIHFSSSSIKNKASMIMKLYERMNGKIGLKEAKGFIEGEVDLPIELQPIFQPILTDLAKEYSFAFALSKVKVVEGSTKVVSLTSILDDSIDQRTAKGVIITRPLDLGESDVYKTITDVRIRGQFAKGAVKFILLGSNNGNDFHIINTLRGKAWKLFRLVLLTDLQPTERISWIDVMYETKFKNRLR